MPTLHVIIPVYNEGATLEQCLQRVIDAKLPAGWRQRLVIIDDRSTDENRRITEQIVDQLSEGKRDITLLLHAHNRGKGAALQTGFDAVLSDDATRPNDVALIQDADLEYDPADYATLLRPIIAGKVRAVVGTRWGSHNPLPGVRRKLHAMVNRALTMMSNVMTGYRLSDMECCYKLMRIDLLREVRPQLTEQRFGIEPQMIATLSRKREPIEQAPVSYDPRTTDEGKKINWRDGVRAVIVIFRERFGASDRSERTAADGIQIQQFKRSANAAAPSTSEHDD